ncbi:MAG: hypothetical protein M0P61_06970 [Ignavibacteriaceae bacterium]|jgi:hypothetical protein|nr:hypothetical protein [Ignavibacteriaceae bacterium]
MTIYTDNQAIKNFALLLDAAKVEGKILIKREDGSTFELTPITEKKSPLEVKGIESDVTQEEILDAIKESRQRRW